MKKAAVFLLLFLASCRGSEAPVVPEGPVAWSASASADKTKVQVGEDLTLTRVLHHPTQGRYVAPPDASFAPFDVIGRNEAAVSPVETHLQFRLAPYRLPGKVDIPALQVQFQEAGKVDSLKTEA